jgi:hypothetical protein
MSSLRRFRLPIFEMRPSFGLPPEEFCVGVSLRKACELARAGEAGRILNGRRHAEAVIGPKPGMLISRRAVSPFCESVAVDDLAKPPFVHWRMLYLTTKSKTSIESLSTDCNYSDIVLSRKE